MFRLLMLTCVIALALVVFPAAIMAGVPHLINYQGRLTDGTGSALDTSVALTFTIYSDEACTDPVWTETFPAVSISHGLFDVLLGSISPLESGIFDGGERWLKMKIGDGPETVAPIPIASTAYAFRAGHADTATVALSGAGGSNWTLAGAVLQTDGYWGIARGGAGNTLFGDSARTMVNLGVASTAGVTGQHYRYNTVGGGYGNWAVGSYSTVAGGSNNTGNGFVATIGGGANNEVNNSYGTVGGGSDNRAEGMMSTVGGGNTNAAYGFTGGVFSGDHNQAGGAPADSAAFVGGGISNVAGNRFAAIAGGTHNWASGVGSFIGGGRNNHIAADYSAILGGYADSITSMAAYSYLFGIKSKMTQDSTFMVDMPHIWFGTEADGYGFPRADGSAGQMMTTDGNGHLSWNSPAGASGWSDDGSAVRLNTATDNVGIGTATPHTKLELNGSGANTYLTIDVGADPSSNSSGIAIAENAAPRWTILYRNWQNDNLIVRDEVIDADLMTFQSATGNIGIGSSTPSDRLHVQGTLRVTGKANLGGNNGNAGNNAFVIGADNNAAGNSSAIGGGERDTARAVYSGISCGYSNIAGSAATDTGAYVGGGYDNAALGRYSSIAGGRANSAEGFYSTVAGGFGNKAIGWQSTVAGGADNRANANNSAILGGEYHDNNGEWSSVLGGTQDTLTVNADYSVAFGAQVYLNNAYRAGFFDGTWSGNFGINRDDRDGGINFPLHVGTNTLNGNGARLTAGGTWTNGSSRKFKDHFQPLEGKELLSKIAAMPIESWQYKGVSEKHIGPVAEDFVAAFDVGTMKDDGSRDNEYLSPGDVAGVALLGVQELLRQNQELRLLVEELKKEIEELKTR